MLSTRASRRFLVLGFLGLSSMSLAQSTTLGVVYLNSNTPNPEAAWIGRGLADMLTTDLSKISKLTVVQREQLDKVLKEQALSASGAVDPSRAAQLGKVLGAQTLLTGSYAAIGRNVRVDLQLVNAATGRVEGGVTAEGSIDSIFSLEKQLVLAVISKLGVTPSASEMQAILQAETFNNQAVVLNYQALTQLQSDPKAAAVSLQQAVTLDPNYASAQKNLRTALEVSGESLVSEALRGIDISQRERTVVLEAARMVLSDIQPNGFKFTDTPKISKEVKDNFTINFENHWVFREGLIQKLDKILSSVSNQKENQNFILLKAPNFGRNGEKKIYLSEESIDTFTEYLDNYTKALTFMSTGKYPIIISNNSIPGSRLFGSNRSSPIIDQVFYSDERDSMSLPLELIKNIKTVSSISLAQGYLFGKAREKIKSSLISNDPVSLLEVLPVDASQLNISAGVIIKSSGYNASENEGDCSVYHDSSSTLTEEELGKNQCKVYTKINDADFSINRLREYLYSGEVFNVKYSIINGFERSTDNLALFLSVPVVYNLNGLEIEEIVNVRRASYYHFSSGIGDFINLSPRFSLTVR